jgi:hypothetical protein
MNAYEDASEPTPQHYGLPENPKPEQLQVWFRQEAFLKEYAKCGKMGRAAKASGITHWCVDKWLHNDVYAIKKRLEDAHADYVELLEEDMDDFIAVSKHNTQIARIFRLRAEHPEKYREEVKVLGVSAPLQMLDKLKELAAKDIKQREALEAPAVEAESREVGPIAQVIPPMPDNPGSGAPDPSRLASPPPPKRPKKPPSRMKKR